ncbi:MAG: MerR family transcriptional regulator [Anaerolineae bacterium]|nr:MerR family transcriptional regulator [Anaerolineae bacterium]
MFKIGDFSKICRIPVSALRYYADIGLLEPIQIDTFTSYRYYSLDQLPRLNRILALKDMGLSLVQIKHLLDEQVSIEEMRGMLRLKQAELEQVVEEEQARLARVAARLKQMEQENHQMSEVVLKSIEAQEVLAVREILTHPMQIGGLIGECFQVMKSQNIPIAGAIMAIYYDPDFDPQHADIEVAFPVHPIAPESLPLADGRQMFRHTLPAIPTAACAIHQGSYETIELTYTAIGKWIETSRYTIVGPPRDVYLRSPEMGEPMTEIQFPVEKG